MIKRNFLYRNDLANRLSTVGFSLFVLCLCMLSSSCDSELSSEDNGSSEAEPVVLEFSTSIEKLSSNSNTRAIINGGVIEGDVFPQGGSYDIGMFITRNAGADEVFPGSKDNMKATLNLTGAQEEWSFFQKGGGSTIPMAYQGKYIRVVGYWPYDENATVSGVPFDFTNGSQGQKELLYIATDHRNFKIGSGNLTLKFAHAYSRIVLNIRKSVNSGTIRVSSASIFNQSGNWIKNKGMINPDTGYPTSDSRSGAITDATEKTLTTTASETEYEFLVPAFMNESVADGNIGIKLVVDGKETVFELKRSHLNGWRSSVTGANEYGFRQGCLNTYELVYDNLTMSLQLRDWTIVNPEGDFGLPGIVDADYKGWVFDQNIFPLPSDEYTESPITSHLYETYLTDMARGNNGKYEASAAEGFVWAWRYEPPRSPIDFAMSDAIPVPVQWRSQDGIMIAKQICKNYREGGYSNWRLPRLSEWYVFWNINKRDKGYLYYPEERGGKVPSENWYWSGSESAAKEGGYNVQTIKLTITKTDISIQAGTLIPTSMAMVRCVRDADPITK